MTIHSSYISSIKKQFLYNQALGWKTIEQVPKEKLHWQYNDESNSIITLVKHLSENMRSRWTDFLTSDGEKEWRQRDQEFENESYSIEEVREIWNKGWDCLMQAIDGLADHDLEKIVYIRNQGHTVVEAINRQLSHYSYHIGQIVFIGKMIQDEQWESLSIPRGQSSLYNHTMFNKHKERTHFTDEFLQSSGDDKSN